MLRIRISFFRQCMLALNPHDSSIMNYDQISLFCPADVVWHALCLLACQITIQLQLTKSKLITMKYAY